jgi:ABC-type sugar transport system ATPase subunit
VIIVSHNLDQIRRVADRIVVLRHGRVAAEVSPETSTVQELALLIVGPGESNDGPENALGPGGPDSR